MICCNTTRRKEGCEKMGLHWRLRLLQTFLLFPRHFNSFVCWKGGGVDTTMLCRFRFPLINCRGKMLAKSLSPFGLRLLLVSRACFSFFYCIYFSEKGAIVFKRATVHKSLTYNWLLRLNAKKKRFFPIFNLINFCLYRQLC